MADIAKETGYSINTVSHALNDKPDISQATKQYIRETAQRMGYIRNTSASALRSGKSKSAAIIVGDISNPHFSVMIKEMEAELRKHSYTAFILNTDEDEARERRAIVSAIEKNVDGIILCPVQKTTDNIRYLIKTGISYTLIGRRFAEPDTNYVVCDDQNGGYAAAAYLLDQGHRKLLFINGAAYISSAEERLRGIRQAFADRGVPGDALAVETVSIAGPGRDMAVARILENHRDVTAVICFSDLIGMEVCRCLRQMGAAVPDAVSVIGFDNIASKFSFPLMLSSVTASKTAMSAQAVRLLMDCIAGNSPPSRQIVLPTRLVLRETTKN